MSTLAPFAAAGRDAGRTIAVAALLLLAVALPGVVRAATTTQTATFGFTHAGSVSSGAVSVGGTFSRSQVTTPATITVPRFDPALGTLTGVSLTIQTTTASFAVTSSGLLSLIGNASATRTLAYATTSGTLTDSGSNAATTSGTTLVTLLGINGSEIGGAPLAATKSWSLAADLAQFSGTGTVGVALTATDALSVTTTVSALNGAGFTGSGTYAGSVAVTYTYTPVQPVGGLVYADTNHNRVVDGTEAGTGQPLYVKLATYAAGACQSPATAAATVNASTGAYSLGGVVAGSYCLILSNNATLADVSATRPVGWVGTETPTGVRVVTVATAPLGSLSFGLYQGASVQGTVFSDTGAGGGTANDGVPNGGEPGLAGLAVAVRQGATTIDTATTGSGGAYALWIPSGTNGAVTVAATLSSNLVATGGSAGTSGGTYARTSGTTTFTVAAGGSATGVNFGAVPLATLQPDGSQAATAGNAIAYAHAFVAGSAGQVAFTTGATASPSSLRWTEQVYLDANCNGVVDAGETVAAGAIAVSAGQRLCLIVKEYAPANAPPGAQNAVVLTATMTYANATPALTTTVARTDTTTVGNATTLTLSKQVRNVTTGSGFATSNAAAPNDLLEYQLTATNLSAGAVASVVVSDATPTYTTFVSAACPGSLPAGVGACAIAAQPAVGAAGSVQWTFTGSLQSGASLTTTFQVRVAQ